LGNGQKQLWQSRDLRLGKYISSEGLTRECKKFLNGDSGALPAEILFRALSLEMWATVHNVS